MAKKLGLLNSDGTPTDIYKAFRNPTTLKASIAEAIKIGYRELFDRNEYAGSASKDEFRGLVVEVTGLDSKDPVFGMICRTFDALKSLADFEQKLTAPRATDSTETTMEEVPIEASTSKSGASSELDLRLSYTINLVLPKTDDPAVFSAIFKSLGHVDYQDFEPQLRRLDQLLRASGVGKSFAAQSRARYDEPFPAAKTKARARPQQHSYRARRCNVLKGLRGEDYRGLSRRLAECPLFRWFCGLEELAAVRVPGKSTLPDYAHWLPVETMRPLIGQLILAAPQPPGASPLELAHAIELETVWLDTTCLKTNLHFPVAWVWLGDAVRTLMKATRLMRTHGLKQRLAPPEHFLKAMNRLSLQMTRARRTQASQKQRQKSLRLMQPQVKVVAGHARRHRELLEQAWAKTAWTRPQAEAVLRRMDGVRALLPQAHKRIMGERRGDNADKLVRL